MRNHLELKPRVKRIFVQYGFALFIFFLLTPYQNCGRRFVMQNNNLDSSSKLDLQGKVIYQEKCSSCHGPIEATTITNRTADGINNALLNEVQMKFIDLTPDEIALIVSAFTVKDVPVGDLSVKYKTLTKNRYVLSSELEEFFVDDLSPNADDTAILAVINNLVFSHSEAFGGNCQRNDANCTPTICGLSGDVFDCRGKLSISGNADVNPQINAISKGYLIRACEEILKYNRAVENVLRKAGLTLTSEVNSDNINKLSSFILGDKILPATATDQSLLLGNAAKALGLNLTDQWRYITLPYCSSTLVHLL